MSYHDWKKQYESLSERDRKIYDFARKATNALGFAIQNAHSDNLICKYEKQSDDAMKELWNLLLAGEARAAIEGDPKPSVSEGRLREALVENLAMSVRRLAHRIQTKYGSPEDVVAKQAIAYLSSEGLQGSVLRAALEQK